MITITEIRKTGRKFQGRDIYETDITFAGLNLTAHVLVSAGTSGHLARWDGLGTSVSSKFCDSAEAAIRDMFSRRL